MISEGGSLYCILSLSGNKEKKTQRKHLIPFSAPRTYLVKDIIVNKLISFYLN